MRFVPRLRRVGPIIAPGLLIATVFAIGACNSTPSGAANSGPPPTVAEVVERHIEAVGGREAIKKITTRRESARQTYSLDKSLVVTSIEEVSGNRRVWEWRSSNGTRVRSGFDGQTAWHINNDQAVVMKGKDHDRTAYFSRIDHFLEWESLHRESALVGVEDFYGTESLVVSVVTHSEMEVTYYFSIETGLLFGIAYSESGRNGRINVERLLSDYRPVGDLLVAHRGDTWYLESNSGTRWHTTDTTLDIRHNVSFPDGHFDLPPAILRLVEESRKDDSSDK